MAEQQWQIDYYCGEGGQVPFREWFESLADLNAKAVIDARITRIRSGNLGKCESIGPGLFELKIYYGPGYRIYFGKTDEKIALLLCGGDKSTRKKDIKMAHRYWRAYRGRKK